MLISYKKLLAFTASIFGLICSTHTLATESISSDKLLVVVRGFPSINKASESLEPVGKIKATLPDGKQIELDLAWYTYIGDLNVRFVLDGEKTMSNVSSHDLQKLNLKPEEALKVAVENLVRINGKPTVSPWADGLFLVEGKEPDLDSSYFLDKEFWNDLLTKYPEGIVVAVPKRGGLLFTPLTDTKAVEGLKKGVAFLYSSSGQMQVSSAIFLFNNGKWSVYQAGQAK